MMQKYYGQKIVFPLGKCVASRGYYGLMPGDMAVHKMLYFGNYLVASLPQTWKSGMIKDHMVKIANQGRAVFVADHAGEWAGHVTKRNPKAKFPAVMDDVAVIKDYSFPMSEANQIGDYISLGFSPDAAAIIQKLMIATLELHKDDPEVFKKEVLMKLPTKRDELSTFNADMGSYNAELDVHLHPETFRSMLQHWEFISQWFKGGIDEYGRRNEAPVVNFEEAWLENQNMILDTSIEEIDPVTHLRTRKDSENKAAFVTGIVLRMVKRYNRVKKPVFVFEEARKLCPPVDPTQEWAFPSSLREIVSIMTDCPKDKTCVYLICQDESQLFANAVKMCHYRIIGRAMGQHPAYAVARENHIDLESGHREFVLYEDDYKWLRFVPDEACCEVKHN